MGYRISTSSRTSAVVIWLAALLASPSAAQEPRLEDLIPDSAVANPDGWAVQSAEAPVAVELDPSSPIDEDGNAAIEWPDELQLPALIELPADETIELAEPEVVQQPFRQGADLVEIGDGLVLALPEDPDRFPVREELVRRFRQLSTIDGLGSAMDNDNIAQIGARARADEALLGDLLRAFGYFDAQVVRTIGADEPGLRPSRQTRVRFDIVPGARYRFGTVDLGELARAPYAEELRGAFGIFSGDFLSSYRIITEMADLERALGETGYAFAAIEEPDLLIDHDRAEGDLSLPVAPGGKYVFGEVTSNRPQFLSGRHLASLARFKAGDIFQRSLELDLRRAISATGLVAAVTIARREVTPPIGEEPGVVALDVSMEPAKLRTIAGAIGYGSEEGFRIEASWEHRNLFPPEGALRVRGIAGTQEQLIGATYRRNNFGGRDKVLTVEAYGSTFDGIAVDARTVALRGSYERLSTLLFQKPFSWAIGAEALATDERNNVARSLIRPRRTFLVGSVSGRAAIDTSDSLLDPTRGYRVSVFLAPEISRQGGAETFYLRGQADASTYVPAGERLVLAGRLRAATVQGAALQAVAPSRRLYAGGGSSVRGYGYQAVGPVDSLGEPTGGLSLVEGAVEARVGTRWFDGSLQVVGFLDAATVSTSSTPDFRTIKYGAGVGVRYKTTFGPIRVDLGVPLNPGPDDSAFAVYVSLGQAF